MDGIVYGTVAGLGVATTLNLYYIIDNEGVALAPGVIQDVTTALAQAPSGGLMGYFMAQAKFERRLGLVGPPGLSARAGPLLDRLRLARQRGQRGRAER